MRLRLLPLFLLAALLAGGCSFLGIGANAKIPTRTVSVFHLAPGDCLDPPSSITAQVASLATVSCHEPHTEEVYALVTDAAGANYPGNTALQTFGNAECLQRFAAYVGVEYQSSTLFYTYLLPSVRSWSANDRTVVCVLTTTGAPLTESMRGAKR